MLFLILLALGLAIFGLTAYVMSWPLVATQLRDRHPQDRPLMGATPFSPMAFGWFLRCAWRVSPDQNLRFLALPGSVAAWSIALGGSAAALLLLLRVSGVVK
ncbi:hypothetical protein DFR29_107250 [Tahibacter aquaticus]|uniref:Uncharacterized protein n=1 Tax=Tahibacter aquaticus TaxID=520092 RepID=A0A4R6YX06_9GAMM|nr:hypothetical protein [Tahibacter aquaticus]TDR43237.1 hypothetical protein DFR29_107250 [Tahibacter aquaticus]